MSELNLNNIDDIKAEENDLLKVKLEEALQVFKIIYLDLYN